MLIPSGRRELPPLLGSDPRLAPVGRPPPPVGAECVNRPRESSIGRPSKLTAPSLVPFLPCSLLLATGTDTVAPVVAASTAFQLNPGRAHLYALHLPLFACAVSVASRPVSKHRDRRRALVRALAQGQSGRAQGAGRACRPGCRCPLSRCRRGRAPRPSCRRVGAPL